MDISVALIEAVLQSLDCRYECENLALAGATRVEVRLFNQLSGEQSARLEFEGDRLMKLDYWDKERKVIETIDWHT